MKNKIKLEYNKRYLFKEVGFVKGVTYFDGTVEEFAGLKGFTEDRDAIYQFANIKISYNQTKWFDLKYLEVVECLDRDCE